MVSDLDDDAADEVQVGVGFPSTIGWKEMTMTNPRTGDSDPTDDPQLDAEVIADLDAEAPELVDGGAVRCTEQRSGCHGVT